MKSNILLTLLAFVSIFGYSQTTSPEFDTDYAQELQSRLSELAANRDHLGLSAAIKVPGQGTWIGTFGEAEAGIDVSADMRFGIASNSKAIVAVLLLKLQEEGLLNIEDPISNYLPDYDHVDGDITIKQLLMHTSGLYDFINDWNTETMNAYNSNPDSLWTFEDLIVTIEEPYFEVDDRFDYSNTNFLLAGMVAEAASGENIRDLLHSRIFEPLELGMIYPPYDDPFEGAYANLWNSAGSASSLDPNGSKTFLSFPSTAGGIWSTAFDMINWYEALFTGQFLNENSQKALIDSDGAFAYGLGVRIQNTEHGSVYYHSGAWGYRSYTMYDVNTGIVLSLLGNRQSNSVSQTALDLLAEAIEKMPRKDYDLVVEALYPKGTICDTENPVKIQVKNQGNTPIQEAELAIGLDGDWVDTMMITIDPPLAMDEERLLAINWTLPINDFHFHHLKVALNALEGEDYQRNNLAQSNFQLNDGMGIYYDEIEAWENWQDSILYFDPLLPHNALDWKLTNYAFLDNAVFSTDRVLARTNYWDANVGEKYIFDSPLLHFNPTGFAFLKFDYAHTSYNNTFTDYLKVYISNDCGENFTLIKEFTDEEFITAPSTTSIFFPQFEADWESSVIDITPYISNFIVRFELENGYGNNAYLANIGLDGFTSTTEEERLRLNVFPNPTSNGIIEIELPKLQTGVVELFDALGRKLLGEKIQSQNNIKLNIGAFANGTYHIRFTNQSGVIFHEKVILMKE